MRIARLFFVLCSSMTIFGQMNHIYPLPDDRNVSIRKDVVYANAGGVELKFDLYLPANAAPDARLPIALFMNGIGNPDVKNWDQYTGWGKLATTAGLAGIAFDTHAGAIEQDFDSLIQYLRGHAADLRINPDAAVLYSCSANVTRALPIAMEKKRTYLKAAVVYYGVADVQDFRLDLPVFYVRAGLDGVDLNRGIDRLSARAIAANVPLTLVNFGAGHHAFELVDDTEVSRNIVATTLEFMKSAVSPPFAESVRASTVEAAAAAAVYREDWQAAVSAYETLIAARPQDSELRRNFGNALSGAGQFRKAIAEYEQALALGNRNRGWISYSAAAASMKIGDRESAMKWIENLKDISVLQPRLRSDPDFASLRDNPRFKAIAGLK